MDPPAKPDVEGEEDYSSDSVVSSEEWQDLSKSDYAKVIFCNLYHDVENGEVGCKFQITDNVHEDPCDYVGLFKVGEAQCLVSKTLSETECEEDGKLLRCVFAYADLPSDLQDGFYQFQYITRDQEICGASTPFEIKQQQAAAQGDSSKDGGDSSDDEIVTTENGESDFVVVQHVLEKKNRMLEQLLEKFRAKNLALSSDMEVLLETKSRLCQEKEEVIENLHQEIISLKSDFSRKDSMLAQKDIEIANLSTQLKSQAKSAADFEKELFSVAGALKTCQIEKSNLIREAQILQQVIRVNKESLRTEPEQRILLEQLEDQKFMIKALEDSKQLALKEMSDLSESLSKRTKVLNQTRCELATCKGKVKEYESIIENKNEEITQVKRKAEELLQLVDKKEENFKMVIEQMNTLRREAESYFNIAQEREEELKQPEQEAAKHNPLRDLPEGDVDVKMLLVNAFSEAETYLALVDKIVEKIDFTDAFQEKAFYELKIMFFVLLGKMKKPNELPDPKESSLRKSQCKKDKLKKNCSRTLPRCQGHNSTKNSGSDNQEHERNVDGLQKEIVATHNKEVQVSEESSVSEASTSSPAIQEDCENKLKEMIVALNNEVAKKNAVIEFISIEKTQLLKNELVLQETVREHVARIGEAAELYKKQFLEIEKLKKKLRHVQKHPAKAGCSKVVGYESSSTAEDVSPLKMLEKAPPTKRQRKASAKGAEKTASPKCISGTHKVVTERQPQMLKVLLKAYNKKAEKAVAKAQKKAQKPDKKAAKEESKYLNCDGTPWSHKEPIYKLVGDKLVLESWPDNLQYYTEEQMAKRGREEFSKYLGGFPPKTQRAAALRSISDSDTGEHVLRNSTVGPNEGVAVENGDAAMNYALSEYLNGVIRNVEAFRSEELVKENIVMPSDSLVKDCSDSLVEKDPPCVAPDSRDLETVQLLFNEEIARVKNTSLSCASEAEECFDIPCVLCTMHFEVTSLSNVKLMDHLENEHQISMCPVCGQLFEATVPKKYLEIHVNKHFQRE